MSWRSRAACRGVDNAVFFVGHHIETALAYCSRCHVADDCLDDAL
jgi:hypothetical protein